MDRGQNFSAANLLLRFFLLEAAAFFMAAAATFTMKILRPNDELLIDQIWLRFLNLFLRKKM